MKNNWQFLIVVIAMVLTACSTNKIVDKELVQESYYAQIEVDIFSNVYTIQNAVLSKLDKQLDTLFVFNLFGVDAIDLMNVDNPNQILLFSELGQRIWILDSALSVIKEINLADYDLGFIAACNRTRDNQMLILSGDSKQFYKIDESGKILSQSDILWNVDFTNRILDFKQSEDKIYLRENGKSTIKVYDEFGNFLKAMPKIDTKKRFAVQKEKLIFGNQYELFFIDFTDPLDNYHSLYKSNLEILDFDISGNVIYILTQNAIKTKDIIPS